VGKQATGTTPSGETGCKRNAEQGNWLLEKHRAGKPAAGEAPRGETGCRRSADWGNRLPPELPEPARGSRFAFRLKLSRAGPVLYSTPGRVCRALISAAFAYRRNVINAGVIPPAVYLPAGSVSPSAQGTGRAEPLPPSSGSPTSGRLRHGLGGLPALGAGLEVGAQRRGELATGAPATGSGAARPAGDIGRVTARCGR